MIKRLLALLLCLSLLLPVFAFAEDDEDDIDMDDLLDMEDIDFDLDENGDLIIPEDDEEDYFDESAYSSSGTNGHFTVDQLEINSRLPEEDVVNILLIGVDSRPDSRSKDFQGYLLKEQMGDHNNYRKRSDVVMATFLLIIAPVLHVLHNAYHFNPLMQFVTVLAAVAGLLIWIYQYDEEMIHSWLDSGLDTQVNLLQSIREGRLDETNTGQFLMSVKKSFPPEVFFDVICYVQLHVELSVAAKSRFMLREAELELPLEDAQKETYLSQFSEFKILEQRLGKSATMTVAPVVKLAPADRKSIDDLLAECRH